MNNIFILIGPTASGKSNLAMKLMRKFPFEIINADLYSTYKGLNIGTAKPLKEELNKYKHHLINILEPTMNYNVSQYCKDANRCVNEILSLNKTPLITGGTMMYVYQLLNGFSYDYNVSDTDLKLIKFIQNQYTNQQIVEAISNFDPTLTNKININDSYRIEKLLERLISNKNKKRFLDVKVTPINSAKPLLRCKSHSFPLQTSRRCTLNRNQTRGLVSSCRKTPSLRGC